MSRGLLVVVLLAALVLMACVALPRMPAAPHRAGARVSSLVSGSSSPSDVRVGGGRPSLSASFINRVLASAGSPAVGLGQTLYAESMRTGIDDAPALGFFWHESNFGRAGVAAVTHSFGNIICAGAARCVGRYRWYPSWQAGADDWYRLIAQEYIARGLVTLSQIIPVYAPSSENDVSGYIAAVRSAVLAWRSGRLQV